MPFSTACTRAAFAMFSSTTSQRPKAAAVAVDAELGRRHARRPRPRRPASTSLIEPPAKSSGSMRPSRRSASVTVGFDAATAVAGWPRLGAGAVRSDADLAHAVDACDRAAAGADLDHLDDRDRDRHAAALLEAVGAGHLEGLARSSASDPRSGRSWPSSRPCRRRARGRGHSARRCRRRRWRRRPGPIRGGAPGTRWRSRP